MSAGYDLFNNTTIGQAINPATITATTTPVSVDRRGFESVLAIVNVGAVSTADSSNYFDLTIVESDDGTTFTAVAAADIVGNTINRIVRINNTNLANTTYRLGYIGKKRYVSVLATETGTASAIIGATILLSTPQAV